MFRRVSELSHNTSAIHLISALHKITASFITTCRFLICCGRVDVPELYTEKACCFGLSNEKTETNSNYLVAFKHSPLYLFHCGLNVISTIVSTQEESV